MHETCFPDSKIRPLVPKQLIVATRNSNATLTLGTLCSRGGLRGYKGTFCAEVATLPKNSGREAVRDHDVGQHVDQFCVSGHSGALWRIVIASRWASKEASITGMPISAGSPQALRDLL